MLKQGQTPAAPTRTSSQAINNGLKKNHTSGEKKTLFLESEDSGRSKRGCIADDENEDENVKILITHFSSLVFTSFIHPVFGISFGFRYVFQHGVRVVATSGQLNGLSPKQQFLACF